MIKKLIQKLYFHYYPAENYFQTIYPVQSVKAHKLHVARVFQAWEYDAIKDNEPLIKEKMANLLINQLAPFINIDFIEPFAGMWDPIEGPNGRPQMRIECSVRVIPPINTITHYGTQTRGKNHD